MKKFMTLLFTFMFVLNIYTMDTANASAKKLIAKINNILGELVTQALTAKDRDGKLIIGDYVTAANVGIDEEFTNIDNDKIKLNIGATVKKTAWSNRPSDATVSLDAHVMDIKTAKIGFTGKINGAKDYIVELAHYIYKKNEKEILKDCDLKSEKAKRAKEEDPDEYKFMKVVCSQVKMLPVIYKMEDMDRFPYFVQGFEKIRDAATELAEIKRSEEKDDDDIKMYDELISFLNSITFNDDSISINYQTSKEFVHEKIKLANIEATMTDSELSLTFRFVVQDERIKMWKVEMRPGLMMQLQMFIQNIEDEENGPMMKQMIVETLLDFFKEYKDILLGDEK